MALYTQRSMKAVLKIFSIRFMLAKIDDAVITYLNGKEIGHSGSIPVQKGYVTA